MQVRKALNCTVVLSALAAALIVLVLLAMLYRVERAMRAGEIADAIVGGVFERSTLRDDYLRTDNERARMQLLANHEEIGRLLRQAQPLFDAPEEKLDLNEMMEDHQSSGRLIAAVLQGRDLAASGGAQSRVQKEMEERLQTQLVMRAYQTVVQARHLQEAASRNLVASLRGAGISIAGTIALLAGAVLFNSWTVGRTVTRRIAALREGASLIGAGRLEHRVAMEGDDEFVELAHALDSMAGNLQKSYRDLEKEISQRKSAEEALHRYQDELELRVAERTEELEKIREELEMQNEELQTAYRDLEMETERRVQTVEELREKERMLIQQGRLAAMGEMLGHIAHQWRQPINVVGLLTQQMAVAFEDGELNGKALEAHVAKTMQILRHLSQTIDDFTNFAGPDRVRTLFQVDEVIAKTISLMEGTFRSQNIKIEVQVEDAPQINGFPNEYVQVLLNILMNARDALLERKVRQPRVSVSALNEGGRAVVLIRDNAGGIDEAVLDRIFDPYFTTKEAGRGTGIGLFMSKTIIEKNMGGQLSASNTGDGAVFRIEV